MIVRSDPRRQRPRLAVTLGDPRGIGPEIVARALAEPGVAGSADFYLVGPAGTAEGLRPDETIGEWSDGDGAERAGRLAGLAIQRAVDLARAGEVDGIVTAPIDKAAFHSGGWSYPGHTEMLAALCGAPSVAMMMSAERTRLVGPLRVVLATTHLPLRAVPDALTTPLLVEQSRLTHRALKHWWGIQTPRIALCAFNPHASDGGLFGDEEVRIYAPALQQLLAAGLNVSGPFPADTVFSRAIEGEFDAVVAPYHDVGMAPFKTVSFGSGVNVTLGLPFPRTSPDHGTALDIAGRGVASASSMIEAMRLAVRLSGGVEDRFGAGDPFP